MKTEKLLNFNQKVWDVCSRIPKGRVSTYKEIAHKLKTKAYRAVGNALNKNPCGYWVSFKDKANLIPCHRVVNSDGKIGGFAKGTKQKIEMLEIEGIRIKNNKVVD
ncbi:MGMT family protein, partial [Candidatus Woesearchaeota archaeon]|nr:MGMT family protein [Candidatus Woesearchaeota archaeon]